MSENRSASLERFSNGAALVDRFRTEESVNTLFEPDTSARKSLARGRGQAWQVQGRFGLAALRHYTRGGMLATLWGDRYWYSGSESTRAFAEFRLLQQMHAWHLPVPIPLGARYQRSGFIYRADLLTAWLPGAKPLSDWVARADAALLVEIAKTIARFHARGVDHADLNAHNVILTDAGVALLDFDRGRLRQPGRWCEHNLERLKRSMTKLGFAARTDFQDELWPLFLRTHQQALIAEQEKLRS